MADYVRVPATDWQDICDSVRGKTGGEEKLLSGQMATEIDGIETGITPSGSINISTNGTYDVTEYAEAVVNVASSGGASAIYSGSFTPAENVLKVEIDVGGSFTHFVCYAIASVTGNSIKATGGVIADVETPYCWGMSSNNSGASMIVIPSSSDNTSDGGYYFIMNNTRVTMNTDNVVINTSTASGTCLGYFIAGVTYLWYAW